jgi:hypothetical protein
LKLLFLEVRLGNYKNKVFRFQNGEGAKQPKTALDLNTGQIMEQQQNRFLISTMPLSNTGL